MHSSLQKVKLRFAHHPAQSQQQPIIVVPRVIQPILIGQQRPEDRADLNELMPVLIGPRDPAHLGSQNDPHVVQADFRQQPLETEPTFGRGAATSLIFIDDFDMITGPAELHGLMHQCILSCR